MLVGWTGDVVVPDAAADSIKHDPLKTVIVANRPVAFGGVRERGHDCAGQMQILLHQREMCCIRQVETALQLGFLWRLGFFQNLIRFGSRVVAYDEAGKRLPALKVWLHCNKATLIRTRHKVTKPFCHPSGRVEGCAVVLRDQRRGLDLWRGQGNCDSMARQILDTPTISEIIEMALSDHDSFDAIRNLHGLGPDAVKVMMRQNLKSGSYRAWRRRVRQFSDRREVYK